MFHKKTSIFVLLLLFLTGCSTLKVDSQFTRDIVLEKNKKQKESIYITISNPLSFRFEIDKKRIKSSLKKSLITKGYQVKDTNQSTINLSIKLVNQKENRIRQDSFLAFHKTMLFVSGIVTGMSVGVHSKDIDVSAVDSGSVVVYNFVVNIEIDQNHKISETRLIIEVSDDDLRLKDAVRAFEERLISKVEELF
jgi:hypothetical protein